MDEVKNQINDLEHKKAKNNQSEQQEEKWTKNEDSVRSLWDSFKHSNIHMIGMWEGEEKEREIGSLFEKIIKLP